MQDTVTYGYGNATWKDLLTSYDGRTISYDGIGNPTNDGIWSYAWKNGRQLASMSNGSTTWRFTYDANGLRTQRTNGTTAYNYIYNGSQLAQMTVGGNTLRFTYDALGMPLTVTYNGTTYYYSTNVQGDIIAILDASGNSVVQYVYDAWGNVRSVAGSLASTLGTLNPLRYRGYVYDNETALYYLQSRYYNPEMGRFLSADVFTSTGQGMLGNNMFAYCGNNPVNKYDSTGRIPEWVTDWLDTIADWLKGIFGGEASITSSHTTSHEANYFPVKVESGNTTTKTHYKVGDASKPISFYANAEESNLVLSSKAGLVVNISKLSVNANLALDDISASGSIEHEKSAGYFSIKANIAEGKIGIEYGETVEQGQLSNTTYTNISLDAAGVGMLLAVVIAAFQLGPSALPIPAYG